jgi:hypothetical protein
VKRSLAGVVSVVAAALALTISACGRDGDGERATRSPSAWSATIAGLCAAAGEAGAGDADAARRTFFDESHDPLHRLADEATERDRVVAAVLLEAKEKVEAGFDAGSPSLAGDLATLADAARAAVRVIEKPVPPPCS